jgi:hypothetical protein
MADKWDWAVLVDVAARRAYMDEMTGAETVSYTDVAYTLSPSDEGLDMLEMARKTKWRFVEDRCAIRLFQSTNKRHEFVQYRDDDTEFVFMRSKLGSEFVFAGTASGRAMCGTHRFTRCDTVATGAGLSEEARACLYWKTWDGTYDITDAVAWMRLRYVQICEKNADDFTPSSSWSHGAS